MTTQAVVPAGGDTAPVGVHQRIYVGLDVGYKEHVAAACPLMDFNPNRAKDAWRRVRTCHLSSDAAGFAKLQKYLDRFSTNPADFLVLLEPTGGYYGLTLQMFLLQRGYEVLQVDNRTVKEYREKVIGSETKTDDVDARLMARMGFLHEGVGEEFSIQPVRIVDPDEPALRVMVRDLVKLQKEITRRRNQVQQVIAVTFPELKTVFRDGTAGPAARALLERYPTPRELAQASTEEIAEVLTAAHAYRHAKRAEEIRVLAQNTAGLTVVTNHLWRQTWILKQLPGLVEARKELVQQVARIVARHPYTPIIESLPVKSTIWTATLIAVIGHRERFARDSDLKAYLGWSPKTSRSGTSVNSSGLSKKGVRLSRNALGQMATLMLTPTIKDNPFRAYYERLIARGMKPRTAQGQVAGKLALVLAEMLRTMTPYDERRHRKAMGLPLETKDDLAPVEAPEELVETLTDDGEDSEQEDHDTRS